MMEWKSVKESLPEEEETVLVSDTYEVWIDFLNNARGDEAGLQWDWASQPDDVTHWMSLPPRPCPYVRSALAQDLERLEEDHVPQGCGTGKSSVQLRDEVTRVQGIVRSISLLVTQGEHKLYHSDPIQDLFIVLDEKLDLIDEGLKGLN